MLSSREILARRRYTPEFLQRKQKPRGPFAINWKHPINRDLCFAWAGGNPREKELVRGAAPTVANGANANGAFGIGVKCSSTANNLDWTGDYIYTSDGLGTGDFTMLVLAKSDGLGAIQHVFFQKNDGGGSPYEQAGIMFHTDNNFNYTANSVGFMTYASSTSGVAVASGLSVGQFGVFLGVRSGGSHVLDIDGIQQVSSSLTVRDISDGSRHIAIGSRGNGTTDGLNGVVLLALAWDRALSLDERRVIGFDPFIGFRPVVPYYGVSTAAPSVPTGTLTLDSGRLAVWESGDAASYMLLASGRREMTGTASGALVKHVSGRLETDA